ncbi:MAG: PEGA domain-containing protein [Polyangia bacterium]
MRFDTATRAVVVSFPPSVIVLPGLGSLPQEAVLRIELLVEQATQRAGLSLFSLDAARAAAPEQRDCALTSERCRVEMARRNQAEYVLLLSAQGPQAGPRPGTAAAAATPVPAGAPAPAPAPRLDGVRLTMALLDAEVGEDAARREVSCESCGVPELMAQLGGALDRLLAESIARPRGVLRVESEPPSAEARIGSRPPRRTPFEQTLFAGSYVVTLRQLGYNDSHKSAQVSDGQTTVLRVPLESPDPGPEPPPSQPVRAPELRRPLWRIAAGSAAIGVGALLAGFGASALAIDGTCVEPAVAPALTCRDLFDTRGQGIGLLTSGLLVAAGGAVLLALPPSRGKTAAVALRPGGAVLSLSF